MINKRFRQAIHRSLHPKKSKPAMPQHPLALWQRCNDLGFFYSSWQGDQERPWQPNYQQWQWFYWAIQQRHLHLFLGARGIGKSEILTIFRTLYHIVTQPSISILILTGTRSRSQEIIQLITRMLQALELPLAETKAHQLRTYEGLHNKSPTLYSASITSRIRGDHPDLIIIEDPLDEREGYSHSKKVSVMKSIMEARRMANERVALIGQFVAEDDPFAQLCRQGSIAILTAWASQVPDLIRVKREEFVHEDNPMLAYSWAINMEGYFPSRDGELFASITLTNTMPTKEMIAILDPAFGGADASALAIGGLYYDTEKACDCLVAWVWGLEGAWYQHTDHMARLIKDLNVSHLYYEGRRLREIGEEFAQRHIEASGFDSHINKRYKIEHASGYVGMGRVMLHQSLHPAQVQKIRQWHPHLPHDDEVDALSMLIYRLFHLDKEQRRFWQ